jgi:Family of unknown function (DUF6252)
MKNRIALSCIAACMLFFYSCDNNFGNNSTSCSGTVFARWELDGDLYESNTVVTERSGNAFIITMDACVNNNISKMITINIPAEMQPGTYQLQKAVSGVSGIAYYKVTENGENGEITDNYMTDDANTGSITITEMSNGTYSAEFEFSVINSNTPLTLAVTGGKIMHANYQ